MGSLARPLALSNGSLAVSQVLETCQIAAGRRRGGEMAYPSGMQKPNDHADLIVAVAQRRDREAFTTLFDYYAPRVNAFLLRMGADRGAAEEMTQDVMITLWRKAALFEPGKASAGTWLYRIARNRRIDGLRRDRVEFRDPADHALDIPDEAQPGPYLALEAKSREEILMRAIKGLPPEQFELVRLAFFESLSHSQVAERAGLPLGTVKSRLRLAFTKLRRTLEAAGVLEAT